jgi:aldehyde:ferredoxin oxidoreductase
VDTIVNRGIYYTRDDLIGLCKFAGTPDRVIEPAFKALYGVDVTHDDMVHATQRTYLRGLLLERKQGITRVKIPAASCGAFREPHQTSSVAHFEDFSGTGYTDE